VLIHAYYFEQHIYEFRLGAAVRLHGWVVRVSVVPIN